MTYDTTGKRIRTENLAGQATTTAWDCCHKVLETRPDGSVTTWDYDDEDRLVASSRLIPLDMTNVTWLTTCYAYDVLGRLTSAWTTNRTAHVGLPATSTAYDALGRVVARTDALGNVTTTVYSPDGRTETVQSPNGATMVTTRSVDGETLSVTGTAVTPEFTTRGVLADGTRWTRIVRGETADSPRYTATYENMLGQTVREETSGFGGVGISTAYRYDFYGRLISKMTEGVPLVRQEYDSLGNVAASIVEVSESEWRKTEFSSVYVCMVKDNILN